MELNSIKSHWENWAKTYNTDLRATTKTPTIKELEIKALANAFLKSGLENDSNVSIMEVGCGNGYNCFALSKLFPRFNFTGVDYIQEMIDHANTVKNSSGELAENVTFYQGNALELDKHSELEEEYDIIFTDRCIINLNTEVLQHEAISQLIKKLKKNGFLILIENMTEVRENQDELRTAVDLPYRETPTFNLFLNEERMLEFFTNTPLNLMYKSNFGSLHDIMLYVITPMLNDGKVDYEHPVVHAATKLCLLLTDKYENAFGEFGQNKLYMLKNTGGLNV